MPTGTIEGIEKNKLSLILEIEGVEHQVYFPVTDVVDKWVSEHPQQFHKNAVVEYTLGKDGKTIVKVTGPGGFKKAVPAHLDQNVTYKKDAIDVAPKKPQAPIIDAEKEQKVGLGTVAHTKPVTLAMSEQTVNVTVTGSYDPDKIHGYEVTDTCQVIQFEPITIKVIGDDPETCRRALIEAWGLFGQNNEVTKETVARHIKTHLLKE